MLKLRPDQLRRLSKAMIAAFPRRSDLEDFVLLTTGETLDYYSSRPDSLSDDVRRVILHAQANAWLHDLLESLVDRNPGDPEFTGVRRELLARPSPPPADPWLACIVRDAPFVDREPLRDAMRDLETDGGRQVLVVHGDPGTGKTHTTEFVRWRARECGHEFVSIDLEQMARLSGRDGLIWPETVAHRLRDLLNLDLDLPAREEEDQQYARWNLSTCDKLTGALIDVAKYWWVVVDSFNLVPLPQATADFFKEFAIRVDASLPRLRLVLLGFNESLRPDLERHAHREHTRYPSQEELALYFTRLHESVGRAPQPEQVADSVQRVFSAVDPDAPARMRNLADAVAAEVKRVL